MGHSVVESSSQSTNVSQTVVSAVAELTGSEPNSIEPLYNAVDPDALDSLFGTNRIGREQTPSSVTFTYNGCDVEISGDGTVHVSKGGRETSKRW